MAVATFKMKSFNIFAFLTLLLQNDYVVGYRPLLHRVPHTFELNSIQSRGLKVFGSFIIATSLLDLPKISPVLADARLNAPSAAGTRVNSDPYSLLNYGLPITNDKEIRNVQRNLETCYINLKTRRVEFAKGDINNVKNLLENEVFRYFKYSLFVFL